LTSAASTNLLRLAILGAAFLFSTGGAAIKATTLSNVELAAARSGVAALVLLLLAPGWRVFWRPGTLLVGAGYATVMVLYVAANKLTTAANTIFLQSTAPIYVLVLAPWLLGEKNRRSDYALAVALLAGLGMFFVGAETPVRTAPQPQLGNLVAVVAGFCWACTLLGLRGLARRSAQPGEDLAGSAVVAGNVLAFAVCAPLAFPIPEVSRVDLLLVLYLGVFQIGLAYLLLTRALRGLPAIEISLLLLIEPVLNTFWAWWVHGEKPGAWALAGCVAILLATLARIVIAPTPSPGPPDTDPPV
jgi:drug/metabolite transporter (DMT)-like permease